MAYIINMRSITLILKIILAIAAYLVVLGFLVRETRLSEFIQKYKPLAWILLIAGAILTISVTIYDDSQVAKQYNTLAAQNLSLQDSLAGATNELRLLRESFDSTTEVNDSIMAQLADIKQRMKRYYAFSQSPMKPDLAINMITEDDMQRRRGLFDTLVSQAGGADYQVSCTVVNIGKSTALIDSISIQSLWDHRLLESWLRPNGTNLQQNGWLTQNVEIVLSERNRNAFHIDVYFRCQDTTISVDQLVFSKYYEVASIDGKWSCHLISWDLFDSYMADIPDSKRLILTDQTTSDKLLKWLHTK
jgi:hypothetical protein